MAVAPPRLYNNYWTYMRDMTPPYGSTHLNPTDIQIWNAYKMKIALEQQGYGPKAIAGVIGNAQVESGLTTGAIQKYGMLPNQGESIEDVPNSYMLMYYTPPGGGQGWGLGLLQWDRFSQTYQTNDLLGWCNANNYQWYDGEGQMARLSFEFDHDSQYNFWRYDYGANLSWAVYKDIEHSQFSNYDAGECANVWRVCWEVGGNDSIQERKDNGNFWYQYFIDNPNPPHWTRFPIWLLYERSRIPNVRKRH